MPGPLGDDSLAVSPRPSSPSRLLAFAREEHERAVAIALPHLQRCGTIEELTEHYFRQRTAVEAWVAQAIASVPTTEPRLAPAIVEETAFWRRAQQLMAAHVGG